MELVEGEVVVGTGGRRWVVGPKRGQGTCCMVYEAWLQGEHKTKVALKMYKEGENFAGAHDREALIVKLLHKKDRGKHIVCVLDDCDARGLPCLVQELLDCDVRQTMAKLPSHTLSMHIIQKLAWQMLVGVESLHSLDFIHGDLKPTNLMWDPDSGVLKVIDLSLSFHIQDQNVGLLQSQGYRAPETERWNHSLVPPASQAEQGAEVAACRPDKPCDLWSVGCILVEMFTGEKLFTKHKLQELLNVESKVRLQSKALGGANKGEDMMSFWLGQLLRPRAQDQQQAHYKHLISKFKSLVSSLLQMSSEKRITAATALTHPFFTVQTGANVTDLAILPTRVLHFMNMLEEEEDYSEQDLADIEEDIREECEKYGPVIKLCIPTSGKGKFKVYVEFSDGFSSMAAFRKLCRGKTFCERLVVVSFYPLEYMQAGRLD